MQRRARLALILGAAGAAVVTLPLAAKDPAPARLPVSRIIWTQAGDDLFGGFSAIEVAPDALAFVAVSDAGAFVRARLTRDAAGTIIAVQATGPTQWLLDETGARLDDTRNDTEGLALLPDGTAFVSVEGPARILRYDRIDGPSRVLPIPGEFRAMQRNSSLESLGVARDGTLYTIPERSGRIDRPFPVFRFRDGKWDKPFDLPRDGTLLPVALDIGPDGRLYVLEREFLGLAGFRARLRSFAIGNTELTDERRVLDTETGQHGNLEGVSVWRSAAGHLIATMIADDNYKWFLATEIVEYDLGPDGAALPPAG